MPPPTLLLSCVITCLSEGGGRDVSDSMLHITRSDLADPSSDHIYTQKGANGVGLRNGRIGVGSIADQGSPFANKCQPKCCLEVEQER